MIGGNLMPLASRGMDVYNDASLRLAFPVKTPGLNTPYKNTE
jgi:hypothetical protein